MAGSSLTYRRPDVRVPVNAQFDEIVAIGFGGLDSCGFHALECLQVIAERRRGAESGVDQVQCLQGDEAWAAVDSGDVSRKLVDADDAVTPSQPGSELCASTQQTAVLFRFRYRDGQRAAVLILNGFARGISVACRLHRDAVAVVINFEMRTEPSFSHFACLLKAIER